MKTLLLFLLLLTCGLCIGQNIIDLNSLPPVQDYLEVRSNPSADTVIIAIHGGPYPDFAPGEFFFFENIPTFSVVEMKQYQHVHPQVVADSLMTFAEAVAYNDTAVAMLQKAVLYYKAQSKKVVVIGHSYGGFLVTEYIDDYGLNDLHRAISMAGRLNMNDDVVNGYNSYHHAGFLSDGTTTEVDNFQWPPEFWSLMKMAAAIAANRYIDSLSGMDLTDYMFVFGTNDRSSGRLLSPEITVLQNGNATVLEVPGGGHDSPFVDSNMIEVLTFIRANETVGINKANQNVSVSLFPNPFSANLTFTLTDNLQTTISLYNFLGQQVLQQTFTNSTTINTGQLADGIYFYELRNSNGTLKTGKVVKQ